MAMPSSQWVINYHPQRCPAAPAVTIIAGNRGGTNGNPLPKLLSDTDIRQWAKIKVAKPLTTHFYRSQHFLSRSPICPPQPKIENKKRSWPVCPSREI